MPICEFTFHRPTSLAEASELARTLDGRAVFLAGGTELLPDFKQARDQAAHLIALDRVPGLSEVRVDGDALVIGALATLNDVAASPIVRERYLPLAEAALTVAGDQIRNQATIGGNFCRAVPCADTPPIAIAGEALVTMAGVGGERTASAEAFFTGPRQTVLEPGEILTTIRIPVQPPCSGASYQRFSLRRGSALAVASVGARVVLADGVISGARVVLGAVAPVPLLVPACDDVLAGQAPDDALFRRAGEVASRAARPITDLRGSMEFRRELVRVLTVRALEDATNRALEAGR